MHGDFAQVSFNQGNAFTRVFPQQGRMLLEAELNEQTAIHLHYHRELICDLVGRCWTAGDGFALAPGTAKDFKIGAGRLYLDGIPCELTAETTYLNQPFAPVPGEPAAGDLPVPFVVFAECWERHRSAVQLPELREVALRGRDTASRAQIAWQVRLLTEAMVSKLQETFARLAAIRDRPESPFEYREGSLQKFGTALNKAATELIAEFGGPTAKACEKSKAFLDVMNRVGSLMRARARYESRNLDPCAIPAEAQFRSRNNQLYRVEIHRPGDATQATFKWSRENGSIEFAIDNVKGEGGIVTASIETLGRDRRTGLCEGDWVELSSDEFELAQLSPPLAQITMIDRAKRSVTMQVEPGTDFTQCTLLRRWDQTIETAPTLTESGTIPVQESSEGRWTQLERGVQIQFAPGGLYYVGDYWLIPARVETNDVIWPQVDEKPAAIPPHGIERHRGVLAFASGSPVAFKKCACTIKPLCDQ
jgi:hypothetical protein